MSAKDFACISQIIKAKAEEITQNTNKSSALRSGGTGSSIIVIPEGTLAITNELLKEVLECIQVNVSELREEFNDKLSAKDAEVNDKLLARDAKFCELQSDNSELRYQLDAASQYNRRENLKIIGVKYDKDEDVNKIVKDIAAHVGVTLEDRDISVAHRLLTSEDKEDANNPTASGKPQRIPSIIVKCVQRDIKSKFFNARKQNVEKAGSPYPDAVIYEDVTPLRSRIMYQLRNRKDQADNKKWKYVWSREGRIYCRTEEESMQNPQPKPHIVNRVEDLRKLEFTEQEINAIIKSNKRA